MEKSHEKSDGTGGGDAENNKSIEDDYQIFMLSEEEFEKRLSDLEALLTSILEKINNKIPYFEDKTSFDIEMAVLLGQLDFYESISFRIKNATRLTAAKTRLNTFLDFQFYTSQQPSCSYTNNNNNNVLLERIKIKPFDGNIRNWKSFWDMFDSTVHSVDSFSDIQKYNHLTNSLVGDGQKAIDGLDKNAKNYPEAINTLMRKYNDKDKLAASYYDELDELPVAIDGESQRSNFEIVSKIINNLDSIGIIVKQDLLKTKILNKFSKDTIKDVLRSLGPNFISDELYDIKAVTKELNISIEVAEKCDLIMRSAKRKVTASTTPVLVATTNSANNKCVFCGFNHASHDCRKYLTLATRREALMNKKVCLVCLKSGHIAKSCRNRSAKCLLCKKEGHNQALCVNHLIKLTKKKPNSKPALTSGRTSSASGNNTFLETFDCNLKIEDSYVKVRGIIDSGSADSYIDQKLVKRLNLDVKKRIKLNVGIFGTSDSTVIESGEVDVTLCNREKSIKRILNLRTTPHITSSEISTCPPPETLENTLPKHLNYADENIFKNEKEPIQILIGNNHQYKLVCTDKMRKTSHGPYLRRSIFGWIPTGDVNAVANNFIHKVERTSVLIAAETSQSFELLEKLEHSLENTWSLESLGIKKGEINNVDDIVLDNFRSTTRFENGRYVVRWPWKQENPQLPSNFRLCMARLKSMLERTPHSLIKRYDELIKEQQKAGIIELAPLDTKFLTHYLPHRGILKGEKLRVVYDASAKTRGGFSLNDMMHRGPVLLENLVGLLLNFRLHEIALTADIEKAFLQVGLNEVDRDAVRFLWLKDPNKGFSKDNILVFRFARVPFGVISSPFLLNMVLQELLSSERNEFYELCKNKFYVDNLVLSVPDISIALSIYDSMVKKLASASFNLRDWTSNNSEFLEACNLPKIKKEELISILGLMWDRSSDRLKIKFQDLETSTLVTKRIALQFGASIYDPLGVFNPSVLKLKLLIQDCWKKKLDWDDNLSPDFIARWLKIVKEILELENISIPRRYWEHSVSNNKISLHVFCDASKDAYACSAYLCISNSSSGIFSSALCYSKLRLAPANNKKQSESEIINITIPKLELLGLLIGKRAADFVRSKIHVKIDRTVLWTDNTIVLQWINNLSILPKFIQNRVTEIRKAPDLSIRHVPGTTNPADIATRGLKPTSLQECRLWWEGPKWLCNEKLWPKSPENTNIFETHSSIALSTVRIKYTGVLTDDFEKQYSTWSESVLAYEKLVTNTLNLDGLDATEKFVRLENALILELQKKYFSYELSKLEKGLQPNPQLVLFLDNDKVIGSIRCLGRIQNASFPFDTIHPIFLPRSSPLVTAIIHELHVKCNHIGCTHLLAKFRERFWISKGRARVKSVIFRCKGCRRWEGGHYQLPPPPPLPLIRVQEASTFLHSGVDLLGPLSILRPTCNHTNIKEHIPIYIALFTCLVTRAVHLEIVVNLSADEFLKALSRFISRRGVPLTVISDNATNFQAIHKLVGVKVEFLDKKLKDYVSTNRILWKFIPQYSPWQGGAYERLVGLVKRCLKKSYGFDDLTAFEFLTALCEIENTINSRPLTYVSSDEPLAPLTPNNFIRLRTVNASNYLDLNDQVRDSSRKTIIESWNKSMSTVQSFWEAFRSLYLTSLRERHASGMKPGRNTVSFKPQVGDLVLIKEPSAPRGDWPAGRIERLDKRQAVAHILSDNKLLIRSINHLYPLEVPIERDSVIPNKRRRVSSDSNP